LYLVSGWRGGSNESPRPSQKLDEGVDQMTAEVLDALLQQVKLPGSGYNTCALLNAEQRGRIVAVLLPAISARIEQAGAGKKEA